MPCIETSYTLCVVWNEHTHRLVSISKNWRSKPDEVENNQKIREAHHVLKICVATDNQHN